MLIQSDVADILNSQAVDGICVGISNV